MVRDCPTEPRSSLTSRYDPHVDLAYYRDGSRESISVSGIATISRDRSKIRELYAPDWKAWFPRGGGSSSRNAGRPATGVNRRRRARGRVPRSSINRNPWCSTKSQKGWLSGQAPDIGETHTLGVAPRP